MKPTVPITGALILAAVLAFGAGGARPQIRPAQRPDFHSIEPVETEVEAQIIEQANAFRAAHGLGPLTENPVLTAEARVFAAYLARTGAFSHEADGHTPRERAQGAGYASCELAENLAWEEDDADFRRRDLAADLMRSWEASPGHRRNLLLPDVVETGVGVARAPWPTPKYIAVQEFGRPDSLRFAFSVTNRSGSVVSYAFEGRRGVIEPDTTMTYWPCEQSTLELGARGLARSVLVEPDASYVLERSRELGVTVETMRRRP